MNSEALVGTTLGTCTLQRIIGQGGMGAVFLAQQMRPHRLVAVKVLLPATSLMAQERATFLERFRRETNALASLEHPNIVPVYEYGECNGLAYLVMPYISAGTLYHVIKREGQLPLPKMMDYLDQLAAALDFAHAHGIIHRDLKPGNILVTPEGRLLLTDFGLVKIVVDGQPPQTHLTAAGTPVGTPDYMAPEQVKGDIVDARADMYSLGVILYQMATGMMPFHGETPMQIAAQQLQSFPPAPRLFRAQLPVTVEQVILRAMAKRAVDRYSHVGALAGAFRAALIATGVLPSGPSFAAPTLRGSRFGPGEHTSTRDSLPTLQNNPLHGDRMDYPQPPYPVQPYPYTTGDQHGIMLSEPVAPGRSFRPRGLFDPAWQAGISGTGTPPFVANDLSGSRATAVLQTTHDTSARPTGLLSRTGMFPNVIGAGHLSASTTSTHLPSTPPGSFTATTEKQQVIRPADTGQLSPIGNMTDALVLPNNEQGIISTMRLTGPAKVVQVPVAGQPGRYVTGILPMLAQTQNQGVRPGKTHGKAENRWKTIVFSLLALLILLGSGFLFRGYVAQVTHKSSPSVSSQGTPDLAATAAAQVSATASANLILSDPLSHNIHSFPENQNEFFAGGAYHIKISGDNGGLAVVLAEKPFDVPNAYTLSMWEVQGDDSSQNNSFGMIFRFSQQMIKARRVTTFYSFEVVNTRGGEYRFYKYDDSAGTPDKYWTEIWHLPFGSEFHQGQGARNINIFRIYQNSLTFSFTINGKATGTVKDSSLKSGTVGMLVNLKGTEIAFMNMTITHN